MALVILIANSASPGLAQERKPGWEALLPAILGSVGKKASTLKDGLKKALEGADKQSPSAFALPASPASPGTITPTPPAAPTIANPRARAIHTAQRNLNRLGYNAGLVDGKMRPRTRKAIRSFQTARNLQSTGRVSAALLKELDQSVKLADASEATENIDKSNHAASDCVIPKAFRDTLRGVQPIHAGPYKRIKPGRYKVTGRLALGTAGRKRYVRPGDIVDVRLGAKKAGWRIGGPIICKNGAAIGVAYRGKGFFAKNGKARVFVLLPKGKS
jgi:peptidoglycan hydrolase-like protein with peptidoglycan-binding domain